MKFDLKDRLPHMICMNQHNMCELCLEVMKEKINQCPFCREKVDLDNAPKNRLLLEKLEKFGQKGQEKH